MYEFMTASILNNLYALIIPREIVYFYSTSNEINYGQMNKNENLVRKSDVKPFKYHFMKKIQLI